MKLQEHVCATLRDDILTCRLLPGTELREQALAAQLGVSKSPVREALLRLVQEGLVTVRPRQGYRVARVSLPQAADVFELRRVLELACVRLAASRASRGQLEALARASRFGGDADDFIGYNRAFHTALTACCGNERLAQAASSAIAQTDRLVHLSLGMLQNRDPERLVAEHVEVAGAVASRDRRTAERLLRAHLETAELRAMRALARKAKAATSGMTAGGTTWTALA